MRRGLPDGSIRFLRQLWNFMIVDKADGKIELIHDCVLMNFSAFSVIFGIAKYSSEAVEIVHQSSRLWNSFSICRRAWKIDGKILLKRTRKNVILSLLFFFMRKNVKNRFTNFMKGFLNDKQVVVLTYTHTLSLLFHVCWLAIPGLPWFSLCINAPYDTSPYSPKIRRPGSYFSKWFISRISIQTMLTF